MPDVDFRARAYSARSTETGLEQLTLDDHVCSSIHLDAKIFTFKVLEGAGATISTLLTEASNPRAPGPEAVLQSRGSPQVGSGPFLGRLRTSGKDV